MLRSLKEIEHYTVSATNGDIGTVVNFLLDDEHWTIRYLVVKTGGFFNQRQVLISPIFFREVEWAAARFHVALTMDKIKNSPSVDADKPVCRQHERDYYGYYAYPYYWGSSGTWGMGAYPGALTAAASCDASIQSCSEPGDVHLRSAQDIRGYHIQGSDASMGHVDDFIVDDATWTIRYLVVNTSNWWVGKKVLISPRWAASISWEHRSVSVGLTRQAIKNSPEWDANAAVNREYELRLYDYYGRPVYWDSGTRAVNAHSPHHSADHIG